MARRRPSEFGPVIRRVRYRELTLFEITEDELDLMERGSADSLLLNFAIFLVSTCASFLIALTSTEIPDLRVYVVFVVVVTVSGLGGFLLLALWWRSRRSARSLFTKIRARVAVEETTQGMPASLTEPTPEP